jgi:hypothetical protein
MSTQEQWASRAEAAARPARRRPQPAWARWSDARLLRLRLSALAPHLRLAGTPLERRIDQLYRELEQRGLVFRPHFWLSDEWCTPDGVPGCAIPFYLAHPRLARLEEAQMLEVEGGTHEWCMRILRHEVGHAIDNAYHLRRRRRRRELFGSSSQPYPDHYSPRPYSRSFVLHLDHWYAQSHPDEDFAETFAVWLNPRSSWQKRYATWPALRKLEYMDELMHQLAGATPLVTSRRVVDPLDRLQKTLREHYEEKRRRYVRGDTDFYDRDLRRLFSDAPEFRDRPRAATFVRRIRKNVRRRVARWTGAYQYAIDRVLADIVDRCRELHLRLTGPEGRTRVDFTILLAVHTMNYLHSGRHRVAL